MNEEEDYLWKNNLREALKEAYMETIDEDESVAMQKAMDKVLFVNTRAEDRYLIPYALKIAFDEIEVEAKLMIEEAKKEDPTGDALADVLVDISVEVLKMTLELVTEYSKRESEGWKSDF